MGNPPTRPSLVCFTLMALLSASQSFGEQGNTLVGYGARQKALSAADVADSRDPMSMAVNPAGIVGLDREYQFGITAILPDRGYDAFSYDPLHHPLVVVAPGHAESGQSLFPVGNGGFIQPIDAQSAWGLVVYGNSGGNTSYSFNNFKAPIYAPNIVVPTSPVGPLFGPGPLLAPTMGGPFGGGFAGIDLRQGFFSLDYAKKFGPVTIGFAPTIAVQMLNIQGLKPLAVYSSDPYHLSDDAYDWSFGGGFRIGLEYEIVKGLRFGFAGATPMFSTNFGKYGGTIADHGKLDIPASLNAGFALDPTPDLTLMAGWRHIFYSAVHSLGAPSAPLFYGTLGSSGGPGLGWRDSDMASFGVEWRALKPLTLRLGYAYATMIIGPQDIWINVLTPALTQHHASGGFKYELTKNSSIDFATIYAFKNSQSGPEAQPFAAFAYTLFANFPLVGPVPVAHVPVISLPQFNSYTKITAWLSVLEFSLSYSYKFDTGDNRLFPTHF